MSGIPTTSPARRTPRGRWIAGVAALAMAAGSLAGYIAATRHQAGPPPVPKAPAVSGVYQVAPRFTRPPDPAARRYRPADRAWPAAGIGLAFLAVPVSGTGRPARAGGTPVSVAAVAGTAGYGGPQQVKVRVAPHAAALAAGIDGVIFSLAPAAPGAGTVRVSLDYRAFAQASGGNYGTRLRLAVLPACALTTPSVPACDRQVPLPSANDPAAGSVSAPVAVGTSAGGAAQSVSARPAGAPGTGPVKPAPAAAASGGVVLAATTGTGQEGGPAGSYAATTLRQSGTWSAGGNSGAFTYSYPITVPPAASSLAPQVGLSYNSSVVDGQTASAQAQASWSGDGWNSGDSFIEQSFIPCADSPEGSASPVASQDLCYNGPILTLSLNGQSSMIVCNSAETSCALSPDNGEVVRHVTNSGNGTGTYNTDYWTITDRNGTVYEFGLNHLPGWASGKAATNSVDSAPVFSAHSGDPCYSSAGFSSSACVMAYRWHLDYVKDVHGNAMAYYYQQDTNYYGQDNGAKDASYVRDSHLSRIDYGFTDGGAYGTIPDKVVFGTADRCVSGTCDPLNSADSANWPDVPFDLICASGATCSSYAPSFFSTVRLASITTEQYSGSAYVNVDSYALAYTMPPPGDGTSATLWLSSITRTGSDAAGGSATPVTLPPVVFSGTAMQNRVDTATDGLPPLYRYRISAVTTETGSVISVTYGQTATCAAPVTITPSSNTSSCFPEYWTPAGYIAPFLDWFSKYVVTKVVRTDPTGGAPAVVTSYKYAGGAAWHYDDNEIVKPRYRTYGQFRGYGDVRTLTGDGVTDPQTLSETTYYRGMSDDNNSTPVTLTDSAGGTHDDVNQLAGLPLETTAYLGNGGPVDHSAITSYWVSAAAAIRTRAGLPALTANWVQPAETYTRQALTDGGATTWRYTEIDTAYDATATDANFGLATEVYSHTVPADPAYDQCTSTTYAAANTAANLVGLPAEAETDSVACGGFTEGSPASVPAALNALTAPASVSRPAQVMSDTRTFYDDPAFSAAFPQASAPSKGDVTMTEKAAGYTAGAFAYQVQTRAAYDSYGRQTASYDANGNETATAYAMNAAGLITGATVTNPLGQATVTTLDPERGLTLTSTDPNAVVTTEHYDDLGRLAAVWLDSRATSAPANNLYTYNVSNTGLTYVTAEKMNDETGYQTTITIYDALLRTRQVQAMTPDGGRMVTDTFYDSRGWVSARYNGWWDSATPPAAALVSAANLKAQVPSQDFYTYDGLGRAVVDDSDSNGQVVSATTTVYNGDRTTTIPPAGGIITATVTDPLGRTTEMDQYTTAPALNTPADTFTGVFSVTGGTYQATAYGYDGHGNQSAVTSAGETWTSTYNLLGQVTSKSDPTSGTTTMAYDGNGNLIQTTDSRGKTISYSYDALDRKTGEYDGPVSSQSAADELASWVYDNSNGVAGVTYPVGQLTTATSYSGGAAYTIQQKGFNVFGESLGETVTIPSAAGALAGSYAFTHIYTANTGLPLKDIYPAAGGLPAETVLHAYTGVFDLPATLGGLNGYAQGVTYDAWGRVSQEIIGSAPDLAYLTDAYNPHTGNLTDQLVTRAVTAPAGVDEQAYAYDRSGNVTSQVTTRLGAAAATETQCYAYDGLDRLTAAWTATDNCAAQPSAGNSAMVGDALAGGTAYWTTWTYSPGGNQTSQVQHPVTGGTGTTTAYAYNGNGVGQPDTLTSAAATGGATGSASYGYDPAGNMTSRNAGQGSQTLTWNDAGQLTAITGGTAGNSSFVYDASGSLLIENDPAASTLYLPGEQITATGTTLTGIRYYTLPGGGTAYRTGTGTSYGFQITDPHGTPYLTLDNTAQNPAWRQFTPYGAPRGTSPAWPDNHGYLAQPADAATGLTIIGARQYDPATGRFISPDPILETTSPQQLNGYAYAADNPATNTDPTGTCAATGGPGPCVTAPPTGVVQPPNLPGCYYTSCYTPTNTGGGTGSGSGGTTYNPFQCGHLGVNCGGSGGGGGGQKTGPCHNFPCGYHYNYTWTIGPTSVFGNPASAMALFQADPHAVFPFGITGCNAFTQNALCTLHVVPGYLSGVGTVRVSVRNTNFTFDVVSKGYFDAPGSKITFSLTQSKGTLYLSQQAGGQIASPSGYGVYLQVARYDWNLQSQNLRALLGQNYIDSNLPSLPGPPYGLYVVGGPGGIYMGPGVGPGPQSIG